MSLAVKLYTAALALPLPYSAPECTTVRAERLAVIALAIDAETERADEWAPGWSRSDWAWAGFAKTWAESGRFDVRVHDGRRRGDGGRSTCLGQIMNGGSKLVGVSLEQTRKCYHEVFRIMLLHRERCSVGPANTHNVSRLFGAYGTGYTCRGDMRWAERRAWQWQRLRTKYN